MITAEATLRLDGIARAICRDFESALCFAVPGNPPSKARPRFAPGGHAYADPAQRAAEKLTRDFLRTRAAEPLEGSLVLVCGFYRATYHVIDVDNMLKHFCDAANRVLWRDDAQVKALAGFLDVDAANPRTEVILGTTALGNRAGRALPGPRVHARLRSSRKDYR